MKKAFKALASIFTAAVLLTGCGPADTDAMNPDGTKFDRTEIETAVYPDVGVVTQRLQEYTTNTMITSSRTHFLLVDYKEEILTKSFVSYPGNRTDAAVSMQTSVSFKDIKDSSDAKIVRDLRQYLPPSAPQNLKHAAPSL